MSFVRSLKSLNKKSCRPASAFLGIVLVLGLAIPGVSQGEWYFAGYGGWSATSSLKDAHMDMLGERIGLQRFPGAIVPSPALGTLTQSLSTSDLGLKNSYLFGGKTGYFFSKEGFSWLGVEVEAFTSEPTIKNQMVTTRHYLTYIPNEPVQPGVCDPQTTCLFQGILPGRLHVPESSLRLIAFAFNVVARYPGKMFQPYAGVGAGAFYFSGSGAINGRQVVPGLNVLWGLKVLPTEEWGLFIEGKYNRATITNFDPLYGLNGGYSSLNVVAGLAYHF